ncbi:MAG: SIR2 family protein [Actinomycetota bacterium]|nr:SIR2 family protein [Actinomycetota bacterium]
MPEPSNLKRVFILGAGFSAAISSGMPLTDDLGNEVLTNDDLAAVSPQRFEGGRFEEWLSRLSEDQPDLSEAENLYNRSLFVKLSDEIGSVLEGHQQTLWSAQPPTLAWLQRFIAILHVWRATVITFNYDTLVEAAIDSCATLGWNSEGARHNDVLDQMPLLSPAGETKGADHKESFRLLKLHGSLNWWWVPGDFTGTTINRWETTRVEPPTAEENARMTRELPGRSRFLVPPSAAKSASYANPLSKEFWRRARAAIKNADELYLVGYSLPNTDLVTRGMLRECLQPKARVVVVNPKADKVIIHLKSVEELDRQIEKIEHPGNSVEHLVDLLETTRSREIPALLQMLMPESEPIFSIDLDCGEWAPIREVCPNDSVLCPVQGGKFRQSSLARTPYGTTPLKRLVSNHEPSARYRAPSPLSHRTAGPRSAGRIGRSERDDGCERPSVATPFSPTRGSLLQTRGAIVAVRVY